MILKKIYHIFIELLLRMDKRKSARLMDPFKPLQLREGGEVGSEYAFEKNIKLRIQKSVKFKTFES